MYLSYCPCSAQVNQKYRCNLFPISSEARKSSKIWIYWIRFYRVCSWAVMVKCSTVHIPWQLFQRYCIFRATGNELGTRKYNLHYGHTIRYTTQHLTPAAEQAKWNLAVSTTYLIPPANYRSKKNPMKALGRTDFTEVKKIQWNL